MQANQDTFGASELSSVDYSVSSKILVGTSNPAAHRDLLSFCKMASNLGPRNDSWDSVSVRSSPRVDLVDEQNRRSSRNLNHLQLISHICIHAISYPWRS